MSPHARRMKARSRAWKILFVIKVTVGWPVNCSHTLRTASCDATHPTRRWSDAFKPAVIADGHDGPTSRRLNASRNAATTLRTSSAARSEPLLASYPRLLYHQLPTCRPTGAHCGSPVIPQPPPVLAHFYPFPRILHSLSGPARAARWRMPSAVSPQLGTAAPTVPSSGQRQPVAGRQFRGAAHDARGR